MDKGKIREILNEADKVEPIAEFNGILITTYEDGVLLRKADAYDDDLGLVMPTVDVNGNIMRSGAKYASVNIKKMFANRIRRIEREGQKILQVVIDYRAISEQATGSVYLKNVPMYEVARNPKTKALEILSVTSVLDTEFMSEFKEMLSVNALLEILPLIENHGSDMTAGELGI